MHIAICLKQVPSVHLTNRNRTGGFIVDRTAWEGIMNPGDAYPLAMALRIKKRHGAVVSAVCMGPAMAKNMLLDALAIGVDRAYLLQDPAFAQSDTLATAYVLSRAMEKIGRPNLILCGRETADGGTAQVGPSLAERMGIPALLCMQSLTVNGKQIAGERQTGYAQEYLECSLPALVSVARNDAVLPTPTVGQVAAVDQGAVVQLSAADLRADVRQCGKAGSPTSVIGVRSVDAVKKACIKLSGEDPESAAYVACRLQRIGGGA